MFTLILLTISIVLMSSLSLSMMNYIPAEAIERHTTNADIVRDINQLDGAIRRYLNSTRSGGVIPYPGNGVDLVPAISPVYGFMPSTYRGLAHSIVTGDYSGQQAVYLCIYPVSGTLTAAQKDVMAYMPTKLPVGSAYFNTSCGALSNDNVSGTVLTYWILLNQVAP